MDRSERLELLAAEHLCVSHAEDDDRHGQRPRRYALVERNDGPAGGYWITTHDTPAHAAHYNAEQESAEDWWPLLLMDLDTGETWEGERRMSVDFTHGAGGTLLGRRA